MEDPFLNDPTLSDPDSASDKNKKYAWSEEFQRHIIALLIVDRQFMLESVDLVKPAYFTNKAHQKMCSIAFTFFKSYRILPKKEFLVQEIKNSLKDESSLAFYLGEVNVVYDYFQPGLDARDYLREKITYFAKMQAFVKAYQEGLDLLGNNPESEETWQKIYNDIEKIVTTTSNQDLGTDYFKSIRDRYAEMSDEDNNKERFYTGLDGIDLEVSGGGYLRGEMISIVAGSGVGKSVMLACITATNLLRGKKGCYITLELAESKVADRIDAILTGFPVQTLFSHKDEIFDKLEKLEGINYDAPVMPLVIKQFAAGTASVNKIRAYISQLRFHGFDPDFIIVDYVGEMQDYPGMKTYESREKLVRDLRGMSTEENVFLATAMQPNRGSKEETKGDHKIDDKNLADSFGQIRPLDMCLSLNQNDIEKELGIGRGYIIKQRDGKSRYQIYLRFDKENLRITEISLDRYKEIRNAHKESVSQDVEIDQIGKNYGGKDAWEENAIDNARENAKNKFRPPEDDNN